MSVEAKVGAFTVGGLMLLGGATAGLGDFNFGSNNDYTLYASPAHRQNPTHSRNAYGRHWEPPHPV